MDHSGLQLHGNADHRWRLSRWLLLALAALAWLGFGGEARAQEACTAANRCGKAEAIAMCEASKPSPGTPAHLAEVRCRVVDTAPAQGIGYVAKECRSYQWFGCRDFGSAAPFVPDQYAFGPPNCPSGQTYDMVTGRCECPSGMGRSASGGCEECSSRNSQPGFAGVGDRVTSFSETCAGGCQFKVVPSGGCVTVGGVGGGAKVCSGAFEWTGQSCRVALADPLPPPIPNPPKPEECVPAGSGQTMCVKPNGDQCYTASTGRRICWKPGETGDKGDGPVLQTRGPGPTPKPPTNPTNSSGDPYQPASEPVSTTTTRGGTTIITTVRNYATENGTDADNQRDGSAEGGDAGDDEPGSSSGGGSCESPPIVSDPALAMIATQAWATRCAVEAGNATKVTGDVGDCASPFSVEGTNANAEQLRAMRVQICGSLDAASSGVVSDAVDGIDGAIAGAEGGDPDVSQSDVDEAANPANWREVRDLNAELADLDSSGFIGGSSCPIAPAVSVRGTPLGLNFNPICNMFINMSGLLIALAYIVAARIIAGVK